MTNVDRRQFLAVGAVGTAGLAVDNKARLLKAVQKPWNARTARSLRKFRDPVPTACAGCGARCALLAHRDGDRVVQVGPNAEAGVGGSLCARGYQALEALYDPERVLRPLRRAGRRGEGMWEEISWAEALDRISRELAKAPAAVYADLGRPDPLAGPLLEGLGVTRVMDENSSKIWAAREAQKAVYGLPLGRPELSHVRTVLAVGARPLDGGDQFAPLVRDLMEARSRGARLIAVGPYQGATGSLADEWIPVRPGTEGLVLLGMARIVLDQGGYDDEAFSRVVGTSAAEVIEALAPYTADRVEATAGVSALTLVGLARRFAGQGPSICLADGAGSRVASGLEAAAAVLNAAQGHPEAAGLRLAHTPGWVPNLEPTVPRTRAVKDILAGNERASLYLAYRTNPVYWSPRSDSVRRAFAEEDRIGLLVVLDTQLTETAQLADLVLPAAADLEMWNLFGGYTPEGKPYAILQQPVPRRPPEAELLRSPDVPLEKLFSAPEAGPLGEARQLGDVLLELLTLAGHPARDAYPHPDVGAHVRHLADTVPELAAAGGFDQLARTGAWLGRTSAYPWAARNGFPTPTGALGVTGRLVHQVPNEFRRLEGENFALVVLSHPELDPGYANTRWGREIRHRNPVYMNAAVARTMGLREGDRVALRTQAGEEVGHVAPIHGIHPQAVAVAEDFGHWAGGVAATAQAKPTGQEPRALLVSRKDFLTNPLGVNRQSAHPGQTPWWHEHGPGLAVSALSPFASDPHGAQAWREISVTVRPV